MLYLIFVLYINLRMIYIAMYLGTLENVFIIQVTDILSFVLSFVTAAYLLLVVFCDSCSQMKK